MHDTILTFYEIQFETSKRFEDIYNLILSLIMKPPVYDFVTMFINKMQHEKISKMTETINILRKKYDFKRLVQKLGTIDIDQSPVEVRKSFEYKDKKINDH